MMEIAHYNRYLPIEPMVIINNRDDEAAEIEFLLRLQLCRKSDLEKVYESKRDQIRQHFNNIREEANLPFLNNDEKKVRHSGKKKPKVAFKIKLSEKCNGNSGKSNSNDENYNGKMKSTNNRMPVRIITPEEAQMFQEPYTKRKSSPLEKCGICKKFFRRMKTHLAKHQILENQETFSELICRMCNKVFNSQANLQTHMRTHTGNKPYVCDICNKAFSQSCNLNNHKRIHTGEKPFKCPFCDKSFTQSGNLKNHIRLHTREKPFKCHFCDKAFVQSGNLNSHVKNNHQGKDRNENSNKESIYCV